MDQGTSSNWSGGCPGSAEVESSLHSQQVVGSNPGSASITPLVKSLRRKTLGVMGIEPGTPHA